MTAPTEWREVEQLAADLGVRVRVEHDASAPLPFAVWAATGCDGDEILGAGMTAEAAYDEAIATMRGWAAEEEMSIP